MTPLAKVQGLRTALYLEINRSTLESNTGLAIPRWAAVLFASLPEEQSRVSSPPQRPGDQEVASAHVPDLGTIVLRMIV